MWVTSKVHDGELREGPHGDASVCRGCARVLAARVELRTVHHFPRALEWQREIRHLPVVDGVARRPGRGPWVLLLGRLHVRAPTLNERVGASRRQLLLQGLNDTAVRLAPAVEEDEDVALPPLLNEELNGALELGFI